MKNSSRIPGIPSVWIFVALPLFILLNGCGTTVGILDAKGCQRGHHNDRFALQTTPLDVQGFSQIHYPYLARESGIERLPVRVLPIPQRRRKSLRALMSASAC